MALWSRNAFPIASASSFGQEIKAMVFVFFGLYIWEYLITIWLEAKILRGRLPFKWPLIPYFVARYGALLAIISNVVFLTSSSNCNAVFYTVLIVGNVGITAASCSIMIRAVVIWSYSKWIVVAFCTMAFGQLILLGLACVTGGASWDDEAQVCVAGPLRLAYLGAYSAYTLVCDISVMITSLVGLKRFTVQCSFTDSLRAQGILYVVAILFIQGSMVVACYATSNPQYRAYTGVVSMVLSPAISCRMVRSILDRGIDASMSQNCTSTQTDLIYRMSTHIELSADYSSNSTTASPGKWAQEEHV